MAACEGGLVFKEESHEKRTIIRKNPEGSSQTNDPELLGILIEEVGNGSSRETSSFVFSDHYEWFDSIVKDGIKSSAVNNKQAHKIPKVLPMLRNIESNKDCYEPVVVSIGPYHHGKPHLQEIEEIKIKYANQFVADIPPGAQIDHQKFQKVADEARKYYDSDMDDNEKFTRMMFLDGCFILYFIYLFTAKRSEMGMRIHQIAYVHRDLCLLENQLPYIVLEALMSMRFKAGEGKEMIEMFFRQLGSTPRKKWLDHVFGSSRKPEGTSTEITHVVTETEGSNQRPHDQDIHLLDTLRKRFVNLNINKAKTDDDEEDDEYWYSYRSAKELRNVGIKFKARKSGKINDVKFASRFFLSGELTLHPLMINENSKPILLNLAAFEMSPHGPDDFSVTSYICFMDSLVDNVEDVIELRSSDILMNYLGSDQQVADMFNDISKGLFPHPNAYYDVKSGIQKHYKNKVKIWMADWLRTHFSSPWTVLTFLAAILALGLSITQTYFAANPPK